MRDRILYLTFDGVLEPLGFSQVARVLGGLAGRGVPYVLLSFERDTDLRDPERVHRVSRFLHEAGVEWHHLPYARGGALAAARNVSNALAAVLRLCATRRIAAVHARSYVAGSVARAVRALTGRPYLFDVRGYWIDERRDEGRWFSNERVLGAARRWERQLYKNAAAVVTLTELQAQDILSGRFGPWDTRPVVAIPTCADFDEFEIESNGRSKRPATYPQQLEGKLVLGLIGSLNVSYLVEESLRLAELVLHARQDAHFLIITRQLAEFDALVRPRFPADRFSLVTVEHHAMPNWLPIIDWGLLLLSNSPAKRGSMPTKLAEFFAAGVRPVHYGCNEEVARWVRATGSGCVLDGTDEPELRRAADLITGSSRDRDVLLAARRVAESHFSLRSGLDRYEALVERLVGRATVS